ncbi:transglutaminaseTgpA domain-containing protein [Embleya sp. NPDC050493]|uniref:transglutaminaseTgpA domain-containing protein n=1 Tax=Embleya sp. NPDC050493 TaxID=3363989 RepID=UPI003790A282
MTGRLRLALVAGLATALTSSSLLPLVDAGGWIAQGLGAILLVALVGEGARRIRVPRPIVGLCQLAALVPYLLLVCVPDASGPIPTPSSIDAFVNLLRVGGQDIREFTTPAPASPGIVAILLLVMGGMAVLVDMIAVTYAQAAPAGLPLLALYSVPAALSRSGLGWAIFLIAALAYVLLLLAEGRERLLRWGRPLTPPVPAGYPPLRQYRPPARGGGRIGLTALAVAVAVPALIPLSANRLIDKNDNGPKSHRLTTINPVVKLSDELNRAENVELMRYRTNAATPGSIYLRISSLDRFDGRTWQPSERQLTDVPREFPKPAGLDAAVRTTEVTTRIEANNNYRQGSLPMPYPASQVQVKGNWRFEPEGRLLLGDNKQDTRSLGWTVTSLDVEPTPAQLKAAAPPPPSLAPYVSLPLPTDMVNRIRQQALRIGGNGTSYDRARNLEEWFARSNQFRYDTKVPQGNGASALENFLEQKVGYCEQFSSAMAVMARTLGIPARVAVGFIPGTLQTDLTYKVSSHDAHAWPELYFSGAGWIRFEPTPSRGNSPSYAQQDIAPVVPSASPGSAGELPTKQPQTAPSAAPSVSASTAPVTAGGSSDEPWLSGRVLLIGSGIALFVLLAAAPMLTRGRVRARRLAALTRNVAADGADEPGDRAGPVLGGWTEVLDTARDLGHPAPDAETPRQATERLLRVLSERPGAADGDAAHPESAALLAAREALPRIALATERLLYAQTPPTREPGLGEDVRAVRKGLLAQAGRGRRLRATLLPSSLRRRGRPSPAERRYAFVERFRPRRRRSDGPGPTAKPVDIG